MILLVLFAIEVESLSFKGRSIKELTDIGGCRELRRLDLSMNCLTNYSGLKQVYNLTWINLSNNEIIEMDNLGLLTNLTYLSLSSNKVTGYKNF